MRLSKKQINRVIQARRMWKFIHPRPAPFKFPEFIWHYMEEEL